MKLTGYLEIKEKLHCGDVMWACAFCYNMSKEGNILSQKPVLGMITAASNPVDNDRKLKGGSEGVKPHYFVPFKKNGKDLSWSRVVQLTNRKYASTEEECKEIYNSLLQENIDWHKSKITELEKEMV